MERKVVKNTSTFTFDKGIPSSQCVRVPALFINIYCDFLLLSLFISYS